MERAIEATGAEIVYVHAPDDSHQDHPALAAARRLSRVLHYRSPSTLTFSPTTFVDVTAFLSGKLAALRAHASQAEMAVVASARHWDAQARIGYAEAFAPTRMVLDLGPAPLQTVDELSHGHRRPRSAPLSVARS